MIKESRALEECGLVLSLGLQGVHKVAQCVRGNCVLTFYQLNSGVKFLSTVRNIPNHKTHSIQIQSF